MLLIRMQDGLRYGRCSGSKPTPIKLRLVDVLDCVTFGQTITLETIEGAYPPFGHAPTAGH